jgi:hypothetical protein
MYVDESQYRPFDRRKLKIGLGRTNRCRSFSNKLRRDPEVGLKKFACRQFNSKTGVNVMN